MAGKIANACAVLHNMAIEAHMTEPENVIIEDVLREVVNVIDQHNEGKIA